MDPRSSYSLVAPGESVAHSYVMPGARQFPRVDEHLVEPETRQELVRGRLSATPPAKEPHAEHHSRLSAEVEVAAAPDYIVASDLLTRVGDESNFATDVCVRRAGIDPSTGARYLEELAFEVVSEQSRREVTERAQVLSERGVRRIVAIFVKTKTVEEWQPVAARWQPLDPSGVIEDPVLASPLEIRALLEPGGLKDALARALHRQGNPQLLRYVVDARHEGEKLGRREGKREGRREGKREGKRSLLERQLTHRFGPLSRAVRERLVAASSEQLDAWALRVLDVASLDAVFE